MAIRIRFLLFRHVIINASRPHIGPTAVLFSLEPHLRNSAGTIGMEEERKVNNDEFHDGETIFQGIIIAVFKLWRRIYKDHRDPLEVAEILELAESSRDFLNLFVLLSFIAVDRIPTNTICVSSCEYWINRTDCNLGKFRRLSIIYIYIYTLHTSW